MNAPKRITVLTLAFLLIFSSVTAVLSTPNSVGALSPIVNTLSPQTNLDVNGGQTITIQGQNLTNILQVEGGDGSAIALTQSGVVYTWGANSEGQLGRGTIASSWSDPYPDPLPLPTEGTPMEGKKIIQISAGGYFNLALADDGSMFGWGANWDGELGNGTTDSALSPTQVVTDGTPLEGKKVTKISASDGHSMALTSEGKVYTWGANNYGQLGNNTTDSSVSVVEVAASGTPMQNKHIVAINAGDSLSLVLDSEGKMYTWGNNYSGSLGNGTTTNSLVPVAVDTSGVLANKTITSIDTNGYNVLAIDTDGKVYSWGARSEVGIDSNESIKTPISLSETGMPLAGKNVIQVNTGLWGDGLAITSDGEMYMWGYNYSGQLIDGTNSNHAVPFLVEKANTSFAGKKITYAYQAAEYAFALTEDGQLHGWGDGQYGQLAVEPATITQGYNSDTTSTTSTHGEYSPVAVPTVGTAVDGKTIVAIAAGYMHTLAIDSDGKVYSWGLNESGQLGNSSSGGFTATPTLVTTAGTPMAGKTIVAIDAGFFHSSAVASDGTIFTWGKNNLGQLGDGTNTQRVVPVAVNTTGTPMAGKVITEVASGYDTTIARASDGSVYSWGTNANGELGDGTTTNRNKPVAVNTTGTPMAGKSITHVSSNTNHAVAVDSNGAVYTWGYNYYGQLGNGATLASQTKPVAVITANTPMSGKFITSVISADNHSVALDANGKVYAWGLNTMGVLGNDANVNSSVPVSVSETNNSLSTKTISKISAASMHTFALASDGTLYAWGYASQGELGVGSIVVTSGQGTPQIIPQANTGLANKTVSAISAGGSFSVALDSTGKLYTWGTNNYGELGNGYPLQKKTAAAVTTSGTALQGKTVTLVTTGDYHSLAVTSDGGVYSWGKNDTGQLGDGTFVSHDLPAQVATSGTPMAGKTITSVSTSGTHSLALASDGTLYTWGSLWLSQVTGTAQSPSLPAAVNTSGTPMAGKTIIAVEAGANFSVALASDGTVYAWGYNNYGQIGNGTQDTAATPTLVDTSGTPMAGKTITAISAGNGSVLAIDSNGAAYAWGANSYGQLGDGTNTQRLKPVAVSIAGTPMAGKTITKISTGDFHSLALASDGTVYGWGYNSSGTLGDGTNAHRNKPVAVSTTGSPMAGKTIASISAGNYTSSAIASDNSVYTWGDNYTAQLGDGTNSVRTRPVAIVTAGTPLVGKTVTKISAGHSHSLVIDSTGAVYAWGSNYYGQLGTASGIYHKTITQRYVNYLAQLRVPRVMNNSAFTPLYALPQVQVDATEASDVALVSPQSLTFVTPAKTNGAHDLSLTFADGRTITLTGALYFGSPPTPPAPATATPPPTTPPAPTKPTVTPQTPTQNPSVSPAPVAPVVVEDTGITLNDFEQYLIVKDPVTGEALPQAEQPGKTIALSLGQLIHFKKKDEAHTVTVKSITENSVVVTIASTPQDVALMVGQTKQVDIDADGENDLQVTLNAIAGGVADLTFKQLSVVKAAPVEQETAEETTSPSPFNIYLLIGGALLLALIITVIAITKRAHKNSNEK
ncbi:MAG: hypothetical protein V4611_01850 [Patescibacteria group bacterium]